MNLTFGYGYLPVIWSVYTFFVFLLCYSLAVDKTHVYPFVPAISDTGAEPPERNIFTELFSLSAYLAIVNVAVRYLQLRLAVGDDVLLSRLNKVTVIFGVLSCAGATLIASFQSKMLGKLQYLVITHDTGAVLMLGSGSIYFWSQTILTYKLHQFGKNSLFLFTTRLVLAFLLTVCSAIFLVVSVFAYDELCQQKPNCSKSTIFWGPADPGYALHVVSNSCEWAAALFFGLYTITFFDEFQKIRVGVSCYYVSGEKDARDDYVTLSRPAGESDDETVGY